MTEKKIQTSTLNTMLMSSPTGGRRVPRGFNPYNGTKEEEIETLKLVFRVDGSNPYKDVAYDINGFHKFKPTWRHNETQYHTYLTTLYDDEMEVMDRYVAINDMMQHMINPKHVRLSTEERYMYSPLLLEYLHQVTPPPAKMPPPAAKSRKDIIEDVFNVQEDEVQEEETKDEEWITKERKDRDRRTDARERTRARLTKAKKQAPTPTKDYSPFESDDKENKEEKVDEKGTLEEIVVVLEDDVLSRLEIQELEYLHEQEETKSAVLEH
jgi:hypothetical protein